MVQKYDHVTVSYHILKRYAQGNQIDDEKNVKYVARYTIENVEDFCDSLIGETKPSLNKLTSVEKCVLKYLDYEVSILLL